MKQLYDRVAAWNSVRYDQEYDEQLAYDLLIEELNEALTASKEVDALDGYCDVAFVALGICWKAGMKPEFEQEIFEAASDYVKALAAIKTVPYIFTACGHIQAVTQAPNLEIVQVQAMIIALLMIAHMGEKYQLENADQAIEAILIVCDSNDTKEVKKTASNVKANINKGAGFVAPEPRLQQWLDKYAKLD